MNSLVRWLKFNIIGIAGALVQMWFLHMFLRAHVYYMTATALAVEAAVLHNFAWHQRYTWADRPSRDLGAVMARLLRFHLSNGGVSVIGNLLIMRWLAGSLAVPPLFANFTAVLACSVVNYLLGDRLVFQNETDHNSRSLRVLPVLIVLVCTPSYAQISHQSAAPDRNNIAGLRSEADLIASDFARVRKDLGLPKLGYFHPEEMHVFCSAKYEYTADGDLQLLGYNPIRGTAAVLMFQSQIPRIPETLLRKITEFDVPRGRNGGLAMDNAHRFAIEVCSSPDNRFRIVFAYWFSSFGVFLDSFPRGKE